MTVRVLPPYHLSLCALAFAPGCYAGIATGAPEGETAAEGNTDIEAEDADETGGETGRGDEPPPAPPPAAEVNCTQETSWTVDFLAENCGGCHGGEGSAQGNFDDVTDLARLVESGKVVPGDPSASPLFALVDSGAMPPASVSERPSAEQLDRLADFITECAAAPPGQCQGNEPIDVYETLELISSDIVGVDADDRPFVRYLTLGHLHAAGYCDDEIEVFRAAMAKLLNALSTEVGVEVPVPLDDARTIYRIDLRDYGWERPIGGFSNKWEALINATPYALERLEDSARLIQQFTGTTVPILMADAMLDVAAQPPLYHDLVDAPTSLADLENRFGIDISDNIEELDVARAGVQDSDVSHQNRVVERHELGTGQGQTVWIAYDFDDDSEVDTNIFTAPLDFDAVLLEVIYSLPNGSHGYLLLDGNGDRVDVGRNEIASDPLQDDRKLRSGISCIGCHTSILVAEDVVREHVLGGVEFDAQAKDDIAEIYLPTYEFVELQEQDSQAYHISLTRAEVDVSEPVEPVSASYTQHRRNVDLKRAAAELGISDTTLLTNLGRLSPVLGPLATGSVKRDTWTARFPETVCLLRLGLADDPACAGVGEGDGVPGTAGEGADPYGDCANSAATICGPDAFCLDTPDFGVCSPVPCESAADCPDAPIDADAELSCQDTLGVGFNSCVLDCRVGQVCPGGMSCVANSFCVFQRQ
ncbi:MAG: hypothetical protein ACRBN8_14805 [Nannocystales bacterium]